MAAPNPAASIAPELEQLCAEFEEIRVRARCLAAKFTPSEWTRRADPRRWSAAECLAHLSLTADVYLKLIGEQIATAREKQLLSKGRYRKDLRGRLLVRVLEPPYRMRVPTTAQFIPESTEPAEAALARFGRAQDEFVRCLHDANGLDLNNLMVVSPFNKRMKYNLYSCFCAMAAHERRHLWQAEQVRQAL